MRTVYVLTAILLGLAACGGNPSADDGASAVYCVNRSDLRNTDNAPLARMCGEGVAGYAAAPAAAPRGAAQSPNSFVRNEAMYRAGNDAMMAGLPRQ